VKPKKSTEAPGCLPWMCLTHAWQDPLLLFLFLHNEKGQKNGFQENHRRMGITPQFPRVERCTRRRPLFIFMFYERPNKGGPHTHLRGPRSSHVLGEGKGLRYASFSTPYPKKEADGEPSHR